MLKKIVIIFLCFTTAMAGLYIVYNKYLNIEKMTWEERQTLYCEKIGQKLEEESISYKSLVILAESSWQRHLNDTQYTYVAYSYDSPDNNNHYVNLAHVAIKYGRPFPSHYKTSGSKVIPDNIPFSCDYVAISEGTTNNTILFGEFYDENISYIQIHYTDGTKEKRTAQELGKGFVLITKYDFEEEGLFIIRMTAFDQYGKVIVDCPQIDVITQ